MPIPDMGWEDTNRRLDEIQHQFYLIHECATHKVRVPSKTEPGKFVDDRQFVDDNVGQQAQLSDLRKECVVLMMRRLDIVRVVGQLRA